jgi:hypothetical protein
MLAIASFVIHIPPSTQLQSKLNIICLPMVNCDIPSVGWFGVYTGPLPSRYICS